MISRQEIEHIADLARIELAEDEKNKFAGDLSTILEFVKNLNEVDTDGVAPLTGGTVLENIMREDEQIDQDLEGKSAGLREAAPEKKDLWIKVKAVFE